MSLLDQVKNAATTVVNTTADLANQAVNSQAAATATEGAKTLGTQAAAVAGSAATAAGQLATAAQEKASVIAPSIVPPPAGSAGAGATSGGVDERGDLSPQNEADRQKLDKLFGERADARELQNKGILKGEPGDALAGKRAELEKSMLGDRLEKEIAHRPAPEELVKKGILNPDEAPPKA